jgi:hypothetical protein
MHLQVFTAQYAEVQDFQELFSSPLPRPPTVSNRITSHAPLQESTALALESVAQAEAPLVWMGLSRQIKVRRALILCSFAQKM